MLYFASIGPEWGAVRYYSVGETVDVFSDPDVMINPIGVATCLGRDGRGLSLWQVTVRKAELRGLWVIIDRRFRPAGRSEQFSLDVAAP